ncbi:MAG: DUF2911 domain-containing protein [Balneolaceae bacterium]
MCRTTITLAALFLFLITIAPGLHAQQRGNDSPRVSPNAAVEQTVGTTEIRVTYGRPSVNGRDIFSSNGLVPYGNVWRTGANETTNITVSGPIEIAGESLPAGTWSLYTVPGPSQWSVILNEKLSWGTQYDESQDLFRAAVSIESADHQEQFLITFEEVSHSSATLVLHWAGVRVPIPVTVP